MTTVSDLVSGHKSEVKDALRVLSMELESEACWDNVTASQRAVSVVQEKLAELSVALSDTEIGR